MERPADLKYLSSHEWVRLKDDVAIVGITDFAIEQLGDLVFVDLPAAGTSVQKGSSFGEIESTKTVSELLAPVSGEIVEVNTAVVEQLERLADSPYDEGWMVKIRPSDATELDDLLSLAEYEAQIASEEN
jgi:glycine cleavage system H protein